MSTKISKAVRLNPWEQTILNFQGDKDPLTPAVQKSSGYVKYSATDSVIGEDHPNWRQIIRARGNAMGVVSASRLTDLEARASYSNYSYPIKQVSGVWVPNGYTATLFEGDPACLGDPFSAPAHDLSAVNQAKAKYAQKVYAAQTSIMGGVVLGELRETLHMIRHPANALAKSVTSYYNTLKSMRRSLKKASNKKKQSAIRQTYLEYTYGWGPLMSDVKSGAEALSRIVNEGPKRVHVRAFGSSDGVVYITPYGGSVGSNGFGCNWHDVYKTKCTIYGAYDVQLEKTVGQRAIAITGMRLSDFLPTVWELIPYSFLVDYFTNIGDIILAASTPYSGAVYVGQSTKTRMERTCKDYTFSVHNTPISTDPSNPHGGQTEILNLGKNSCALERFDRIASPNLMPSFEFTLGGLSPRRILNVVALLPNFRKLTPF